MCWTCEKWKLTWDSFVAPQITEETLGLAAHHAIASCDNGTPSSSAIGFRPSTFRSTSSTSDRAARFYNNTKKKKVFHSHFHNLFIFNYRNIIIIIDRKKRKKKRLKSLLCNFPKQSGYQGGSLLSCIFRWELRMKVDSKWWDPNHKWSKVEDTQTQPAMYKHNTRTL